MFLYARLACGGANWYTSCMTKRGGVSRQSTRDQQTVVLEDIRGTVKLIHEAVQPIPRIQEKLDATFDEVGNLRVEMDAVKVALKILGRDVESVKKDMGTLKQDVGVLKQDVGVLKGDMSAVKGELRTIKNDLKVKVDREEFEALEERVERLEEGARVR